MQYLEFKPNKHLEPYVECYWYAYSDKPPFREKESLIPDGTIELMFNFGDNYARMENEQPVEIKGSHIIGIRKKALVISQTGKQHFFCIRFKLGGTYPFFRIPAHLFAGDFFNAVTLLGNEVTELEEQLYGAENNEARVVITNHYLLRKLMAGNRDYLFVEKCVPVLLRSGNILSVAADFNTGYKTLERKFSQVLGLSPSELLKINRFNQAVLQMYACRHPSLTGIAHASGYFDQSHFIREFKQLTNLTPREFLKAQFTIVQVIQPALAERMSKSYNF